MIGEILKTKMPDQHAGTSEGAIAKLQRLKEQKAKKERDAKIKEIKDRIALRQPTYRYEIPKMPPREGTKEYERWLNPWRSLGQKKPGFTSAGSPAKAAKELKEAKSANKKKNKKKSGDDSDSDSDSDDDDDGGSTESKKQKAKKYEDFVIPDVMDAQTGKPLNLTKAFWTPEEGRLNNSTQALLDRATGRLSIANRPDSSAVVIETNTPYRSFEDKKQKSVRIGEQPTLTRTGSSSSGTGSGSRPGSHEHHHGQHGHHRGHHGHGNHHGHGHHNEHHHYHGAHHLVAYHPHSEGWREKHHHHHGLGHAAGHEHRVLSREGHKAMDKYANTHRQDTGVTGMAEHHHNALHHLHIDLHGEAAKHVHVHHHNDDAHHIGHGVVKKEKQTHHRAAKRDMNDLVAQFLKEGPLKPMYHVHWDRATDVVITPKGYVNDEDGDAESYLSYSVEGPPSSQNSARSSATSASSATSVSTSKAGSRAQSRRSSVSSVGWDSVESNRTQKLRDGKKKEGEERAAEENDSDSDESSKVSILSDALDPENTVTWRALEDKYYDEIRNMAVEYETNKAWTKEKSIEGGPHGMDIKCREYASWKARCVKFIVQAIDDEKDKDDARVALEDELEINNPERLLDTVKKHNNERHKHRTYLKTFKYEIEILSTLKLSELGLVW